MQSRAIVVAVAVAAFALGACGSSSKSDSGTPDDDLEQEPVGQHAGGYTPPSH